jgi:hypothetical protein
MSGAPFIAWVGIRAEHEPLFPTITMSSRPKRSEVGKPASLLTQTPYPRGENINLLTASNLCRLAM